MHSVQADVPLVDDPASNAEAPDWSFLLMCSSALTPEQDEAAQDAVLRVAQGCLRSHRSTDEQKAAAILLLDRVGNQPAIDLARARDASILRSIETTSSSLILDAMGRRAELTVTLPSGAILDVNPFQKDFWDLASINDWVSVSAPTSAGSRTSSASGCLPSFAERNRQDLSTSLPPERSSKKSARYSGPNSATTSAYTRFPGTQK